MHYPLEVLKKRCNIEVVSIASAIFSLWRNKKMAKKKAKKKTAKKKTSKKKSKK